MKKSSTSLRAEVGIPIEPLWNAAEFDVPPFFAFDVGRLARKLAFYSLLAAVLWGLKALLQP